VQAAGGRFRLLDTLRSYAAERLDETSRRALRGRHARHVAARVADLRWSDRPESEAQCVAELANMTADLHQAWGHAAAHDRSLAVELAALVYDFAYPRQRRDLLDWGRRVADWEVEHPLRPLALASGVSAAWVAGDFEEAERIAVAHADAEDGSPVWARLVGQWGNLAMFAGRTELAIERFHRSAHLHRVGGLRVYEVMTEICVCQAMAYGGGAQQARERLPELRARAWRTGNPSAAAWAEYVTGEAIGESDVAAALQAYENAEEAAQEVDHRLFLNLARSGSAALTARHGPPEEAAERLERLMTDWEDIGNVAAQWWLLRQVALFLERVGHDHEAMTLFGAVESNAQRTFLLMGEAERLADCLQRLRERNGDEVVVESHAAGAHLTLDAAANAARQALQGVAEGRHRVRPPGRTSPLTQ
jgi:hypothetical protein